MTLWKCKRSVSDVFTMSYSGRETRGTFREKKINKNYGKYI